MTPKPKKGGGSAAGKNQGDPAEPPAEKNKGGRRELDADEKRDTLVRVLVNVAEYADLQKGAKYAHLPLSTWLRQIGLERAQALIAEKEAARNRDER
jgi:hypothetical protein